MAQKIYGVDLNQKVTPMAVRDAMIECFYQAHCIDSGVGIGQEEGNKNYCKIIVKRAFEDAGGDFKKPTKKTIMGALDNLVGFAKVFRDPEIIKRNYREMMTLVDKL